MKNLPVVLIFVFTTYCSLLFAQTSDASPFLRYPSLSADGSFVAFSYQGDIWVASAQGGPARRLTIHESYEWGPQWSADDRYIAFQGNRYGNDDVFVIETTGNQPDRLTFHSTNDGNVRWGADNQLFFSTRRAFAQVEREGEVYRVGLEGGTPQRALEAVALSPAPSPNGRFMALVRGTCRTTREAYRGPANRNIWLYDVQKEEYRQLTDFEGQDIQPEWGADNSLYYLSAANGRYNIYRQQLDKEGMPEGEAQALTSYTDEGIRYFDVSADGRHLVFEKGIRVYKMETKGSASPEQLNIQVTGDYRFDPVEHKTFTNNATTHQLSPNEKYQAFVVRGEIFVKPNDQDKRRAVQLTQHPYNDAEPQWLNDSTLIFVSDRDGNYNLYALYSSDPDERNLYRTFKLKVKRLSSNPMEEEDIHLSPDRKKIAFRRGRGQLIVADIAADGSMSNEQTLLDGWDAPGGISFSPDSKWLAYSLDDLSFNQEIYIHPVDGSQPPVNVSLHPRRDSDPVWSRDGKKLGFLSTRNNGDSDVWFVWLKKEDWEKTKRDWEEMDGDEDEQKEKKNGSDPIVIDFEDIHERIQQVTRLAGNERNLEIAADGERFYFTTNGGGRQGAPGDPELMSVKWDGTDLKTLLPKAQISALQLDQDGKKLYGIKSGGSLVSIDLNNGKQQNLPFSAKMDIHRKQEREQAFLEAWRRLRDGFYDPDFHGQNWEELKDKYFESAMQASTEQDFRTLTNEMLGQLNSSHMGFSGSSPEETQREQTGLLGVEVDPMPTGVRVTRVVPNTPADRSDSQLQEGDVILSVNGQVVTPSTNFYQLLNGLSNERVLLEVDYYGDQREVIIRPTGSIRSELYSSWVKERQKLTEEYSGGRLGYIHIQGMNWPSFERFERELTASGLGKEGIVIDVRYNGGGWTTDMLLTVLNVRQHAYTIPRGAAKNLDREHQQYAEYYPYGERLPLSSWTKPSIALCNENSYSNAEIFSHAYKNLGIGTLVGQATFGAVISTGGNRMMNGSYVRMPYRAWYVKATQKNMEHGPAVPDIIVANPPEDKAKGEDLQLRRAVEELLRQIDQ